MKRWIEKIQARKARCKYLQPCKIMKKLSLFRFLVLLVTATMARGALAQRDTAKTPATKVFGGTVFDSQGAVVAGAKLHVYWQGTRDGETADLGETRSNAQGQFTQLVTDRDDGDYLVVAQTPDLAPALVHFPARSENFPDKLVLTLLPDKTLTLTVADSKGAPLVGAEVGILKLELLSTRLPEGYSMSGSVPTFYKTIPLNWTLTPRVITGADGVALLRGLPQNVAVVLIAHKKGYADNMVQIFLRPNASEALLTYRLTQELMRGLPFSFADPEPKMALSEFDGWTPLIKLARETVVRGRLILDDAKATALGQTRTLGTSQWRVNVKFATWYYPWSDSIFWPSGEIDENGAFLIRNVPTLEVLGEWPPLNAIVGLDFTDHEPRSSISVNKSLPYSSYDHLVTLEHDGKTEYWISYGKGKEILIKYGEGENITHDIHFSPLAKIQGQIRDASLLKSEISYHNPRSGYWEDWKTTADATGAFEMLVPVGDVTLRVGTRNVALKNLQPHATRRISIDATDETP